VKNTLFLVCALLILVMGCNTSQTPIPLYSATPNDFLSARKYDSLVVEIEYVTGFQPSPISVDNLHTYLQGLLNKPKGIKMKVNPAGINSPNKQSYTLDDVSAIEANIRSVPISGSTLSVFIFFADALYEPDVRQGRTLGTKYRSTSIVMFEKTIQRYAGHTGQPSIDRLETSVLMHEMGHIMGLVNLGTPMQTQHEDTANKGHCADKNCLMYWALDDVILSGGSIPSLNQDCVNDLKANGGK
jgi:hypothetical protein